MEPLHEDVARVQVPEPHLPPNHPTQHPACHWVSALLNHSNSCMTLISIKHSSSAEDYFTYIWLLCSGRSCKNGATGWPVCIKLCIWYFCCIEIICTIVGTSAITVAMIFWWQLLLFMNWNGIKSAKEEIWKDNKYVYQVYNISLYMTKHEPIAQCALSEWIKKYIMMNTTIAICEYMWKLMLIFVHFIVILHYI